MSMPNNLENASSIAPDWLKSELFEDILKSNIPDYRQIKKFKAENGTAAGENFATIILRIQIEVELNDGTLKSISYMLKLSQQNEVLDTIIEKTNIFDIEFFMYKYVVSEFEQMYKDKGIEVKFGSRCLEIDAPVDYVLLEDLCPSGFMIQNRLEGLNVEHTQSVLRKLAQWHAASAVRIDTKGLYPEDKTRGFSLMGDPDILHHVCKQIGHSVFESFSTYNNNEIYIDDIIKLQPHIPNEAQKLMIVDPDEFNVLNHGDCWINNIMFQYGENDKIKETYLIDYQLPKYGSPAQDLLYFLISSTKLEDKLSKFDYYIKYYHDHLVENLKLLDYSKKIPALREIHISLLKRGFWGYWTAIGIMSLSLLEPTEASTLNNFVTDSSEGVNLRYLLYTNSRYRSHAELIFPWLQRRGALEL